MTNLYRKQPSDNIRLKLMECIIDECIKNNSCTTLINSIKQDFIPPIYKFSTIIPKIKRSSNKTDKTIDKFEKAMRGYNYLQKLAGKSSKNDTSIPPRLKRMTLKVKHPIKDQTDKALQTVNFDNLTNIILEKTLGDSKKKSMTKKELKIETEIEISEFNKILPSPSGLEIVKSTMSNISNYSNDFKIKMNRCATTSSNSSYSSHYMFAEDCTRYYDNDDEYYGRFGEFQIKLKSCLARDRTFSQITPTSSDLELN
jgi:hypothetical protein